MDSTVILDWGSDSLKAGTAVTFPSEDDPQILIPSAVQSQARSPSLDGESDSLPSAQHVTHEGRIVHWPGFEAITHHCLYNQVCCRGTDAVVRQPNQYG